MKNSLVSWNECISIKKIIEIKLDNLPQKENYERNEIIGGITIDSILSNIPTALFILFKIDNKIYINQYSLVQYLRNFLEDKIEIKSSNNYLNNISEKTYKQLTKIQQEDILNYLLNCTIIDLNGCEKENISKIIYRYC
ncbi:hypothetical protein [Clostridium sporogenes]|uniref:hypothetical protein n=1 Tax=Clostridium sporogenes TaxID=1509 RepID=UPI00117DA943|nr:hypothetical protein [Clostridium sporogenes]MDU4596911.1 hypothetical protein [Clostridium sporogenes]NFQ33521.1 hypothetical protein [Clostridium sporogenes]NFQ59064.1 hypothetical protein [Clostridium sporogenes]NFU09112.1 hypothetical protein [Clostridium sporogenes]NFU42231.1 hypothetical protein [Clostridium sporogenes]